MKSIWSKNPAEKWEDAFPIGNGRLGAKFFGKIGHESILLNEESVWSGPYTNRNNKNSSSELKNIRHLMEISRFEEAQELVYESFTALPENQKFYESAGSLEIDFYDPEHYALEGPFSSRKNSFEAISNYRRELDLEAAVCKSVFTTEISCGSESEFSSSGSSSVTYTREAFVSASADVLVLRVSASVPKSIYFRAKLDAKKSFEKYSLADDTLVLNCIDGIPYSIMMSAVNYGGKTLIRGDNLIIERADEVLLFVDIESAYRKNHYRKRGGNVFKRRTSLAKWSADLALKKICFASSDQYLHLKSEHIDSFSHIENKQNFSLNTDDSDVCLEELFADKKNENKLAEFYWNYSRYAFISSTRNPGTLPSLKKGLWYNGSESEEERKFDLNCALKICFPGSLLGCEELDEKFLKFVKENFAKGRKTAESMYGTIGYACHTKTDIWGDSAPDGSDLRSSYNVTGGAFIGKYIGEYFEYCQNRKVLKKYKNAVKTICEFYSNYMLLVDDKRHFVLSPSFSNGIKNNDGTCRFICVEHLQNNKSIKDLFSLFLELLNAQNVSESDNLILACKSILEKIKIENCSDENILLEKDYEYKKPEDLNIENINDFAEMTNLVVSSKIEENRAAIYLLPALPEKWSEGSLSGINLKGNILINLSWSEGKIKSANVYTRSGKKFIEEITVCYKGKRYNARLVDGTLDLMNVLPTTV